MDKTSRSLLEKVSNGESKGIREMWMIWSPKIMVFLNNCPELSEEDREDLHQEIMSKIIQSSKSYNQKYAPSTWIYTIAKRILIDWKRKSKSRLKVVGVSQLEINEDGENIIAQIPGIFPTPDVTIIQNEEQNYVQQFIASQSDRDRQILFLYCYENLSGRAVAKILNLPVGTVRDRLRKLKKCLQEEMK